MKKINKAQMAGVVVGGVIGVAVAVIIKKKIK